MQPFRGYRFDAVENAHCLIGTCLAGGWFADQRIYAIRSILGQLQATSLEPGAGRSPHADRLAWSPQGSTLLCGEIVVFGFNPCHLFSGGNLRTQKLAELFPCPLH